MELILEAAGQKVKNNSLQVEFFFVLCYIKTMNRRRKKVTDAEQRGRRT